MDYFKETLKKIGKRYYLTFETICIDEYNFPFMLQSVPKYSASKIFQIVKSITAIKMFEDNKEIKEEFCMVVNSGAMGTCSNSWRRGEC